MRNRHSMPFGAEVLDQGVRFSIWAPAARYVTLHVGDASFPMESRANGFFVYVADGVKAGARYTFSFDDAALRVPDPASRYNPEDVHEASEVVDPERFVWSDHNWRGRPWTDAVIYELHIGTFTKAGTYAAAQTRLDYLAELGVTAIELMPLSDTPGKCNWGYDGVLPFAPEHGYGRPEDLKRFIEAAHQRNLMVLIDVVYNHFGPDGNYLNLYAPQFFTEHHHTPWGNAINFDDVRSDVVRQFFIHNALYWLEEYHFDGLRLDAVHSILDDSKPDFLTELAHRVAQLDSPRQTHLVLENDNNASRYLQRDARGQPVAYTAQWNDDFHHTLRVLLTGDTHGHYQDYDRPTEQFLRYLVSGFAYQGERSGFRDRPRGESTQGLPAEAFVNFLQNHDQIGNRPDGQRMWMLLDEPQLRAAETLLLLLPSAILIFMGDEFHAPNSFPFFCDFNEELATAVREGRRKDFAALFADIESMPDPNDPCEREAAVLDWTVLAIPQHRQTLDRYRHLLRVRRERLLERLPAQQADGKSLGEGRLQVHWQLRDGTRLSLLANLTATATTVDTLPSGSLLAATHDLADSPRGELPPWFVAWHLEQ